MIKEEEFEDIIFYNKASSKKLGWKPSWFGVKEHGGELARKILAFQESHDIIADGKCGPICYRRILTERSKTNEREFRKTFNHIICNDSKINVNWPTITFLEEPKWAFPKNCYKKDENRIINKCIIHWDATLNAKITHNVLVRNGTSTHFCIDNDGTIIQYLDPKYKAYHAPPVNGSSIGIDLSNAFYLSNQVKYIDAGFPARPIVKDCYVNGKKLESHLGFYPLQISALEVLLKTLTKVYNIPLTTPTKLDSNGVMTENRNFDENFKEGIGGHYNVDKLKRKIDPGNLPFIDIIEKIKNL